MGVYICIPHGSLLVNAEQINSHIKGVDDCLFPAKNQQLTAIYGFDGSEYYYSHMH